VKHEGVTYAGSVGILHYIKAYSYGSSPGVSALVRLWVACGTSREIQREFERAVLDIKRKTINPPESGEFDDDCL
jgi:hypothetical protein